MKLDSELKKRAIRRWKIAYHERQQRILQAIDEMELKTEEEQATIYAYIKPHYEALLKEYNERAGMRHGLTLNVANILKDEFYPSKEGFTLREVITAYDKAHDTRISAARIENAIRSLIRQGHLYIWCNRWSKHGRTVETRYQFTLCVNSERNGQPPDRAERQRRSKLIYEQDFGPVSANNWKP